MTATERVRTVDVKTVARKARKTAGFEWRTFWQRKPIKDDIVLYEAFLGDGVLDNPEAIFRELLAAPDMAHLTHYWVLNEAAWEKKPAEFASHPRVRFVRYRSAQYFRLLATAKYLVNNSTFPYEFGKRPGQVYLNTWHGTPLKAMGYDEPKGGVGARNVLRNLVSADYLLTTSDYMTERLYECAYRLRNVYAGKIIRTGTPRVDRQTLSAARRSALIGRLEGAGVTIEPGDKVVLYAPTWRGESFHAPTNDVAILEDRVRQLRDRLPEGYRVLLKVHQQAYAYAAARPGMRDLLVPNDVVTNELLGLTDVLVNDYSSIFFDFLATGRPIIFFAPDRSDYTGYRGLYLSEEELPGPTVTTITGLAAAITAAGNGSPDDPAVSHAAVYREAQQRFTPLEHGGAASRVVDIVWRGAEDPGQVFALEPDGRERILMFLGGMLPNGITSSVLNLLDNIDHDRFDVSVFYVHSERRARSAQVEAINPRVRLFPRVGSPAPSKFDRRQRLLLLNKGLDSPGLDPERADRFFKDEWRRCFGSARFDYIVDFSGYSPNFAYLMLTGPAKSRSIWLHNDFKAEMSKVVDGERPHETNMQVLGSMMPRFDHVVSVSEALNEVNRANFARPGSEDRFTSARNSIRYDAVLENAFGMAMTTEDAVEPVEINAKSLADAVQALSESYPLTAIEAEAQRRMVVEEVVPTDEGVHTFVTTGRLAAEKNHKRLIRAFDIVHQQHPRSRLVIVGSGGLQSELELLIAALGLRGVVTLAGQQPNPHAIMAACDTFVLSSNYEGQPMVLLEARVLGLPIVSTRFGTVSSALPDGAGLIVENNEKALAEGMIKAMHGDVKPKPFDAARYNDIAVEEFYRAIGASEPSSG
jgi:CDP-glycerol glycerophosphotransferase